ncbi:hypothetical protein Tco_0940262 [Tanacetum coccineum]|uniref:Retrovirus-related Pol polyprotein from transposon TNT 1-94-like beta-barrel domain-containing protein n=1 Tax=Tanacetum coccineum TaxID=301880 RepID=A0ABQ5DPU4_9ASTR
MTVNSTQDYLKRFVWYLDSGCSRHMTGVKQYLHRYSKDPGPKVVFGDDSLRDTEGYGSINCNGITFTREPFSTKKIKLSSLLLKEEMSMSLICHLSTKITMLISLPKLHLVLTGSACEKGKHHRASFKTKRSFSITKSLHLLYMDLFGPVKPQTISHNKYILVIVDEYSRKIENLNEVRVKELRSLYGTELRKSQAGEFYE